MKMKTFFFVIILFVIVGCKEFSATGSGEVEENIGIIIGDIVNVRETPAVNGKIISQLKDGAHVKVTEKTQNPMQVGKHFDRWVKIRTKENVAGYVFGAFLFELDELFRGFHWNYVTYSEWAFGLKFKRDKKVTFVYAYGTLNKAEYEYDIQGRQLILKGMKADFLPSTLYFYRYQSQYYLARNKLSSEPVFSNEIEKNQALFSNRNSGMENFIKNFRPESRESAR